jgi:hypothetical protein
VLLLRITRASRQSWTLTLPRPRLPLLPLGAHYREWLRLESGMRRRMRTEMRQVPRLLLKRRRGARSGNSSLWVLSLSSYRCSSWRAFVSSMPQHQGVRSAEFRHVSSNVICRASGILGHYRARSHTAQCRERLHSLHGWLTLATLPVLAATGHVSSSGCSRRQQDGVGPTAMRQSGGAQTRAVASGPGCKCRSAQTSR